jgi:type VI secretion system secreted protein VgrG
MALLTQRKFSFTSTAAAPETFAVVSFSGIEALSTPYRFDLVLLTEKSGVNALDVLKNPATFTIHRDGEEDVLFNGILTQFEETREVNNYLFFRAVLAPRLQRLALIQHNQVFLDQPVPKIIEAVLKEAGLVGGMDFEFKLQGDYQPREYVCEYGESHLNFISRWAEREGIYYFFEQGKNGEKIIFTDTKISHTDLPLGKDLIYNPQSGLDSLQTSEVVNSFICKHNLVPQKVYLKDYNYRKPSLTMEGSASADPDGWGEHYIYGEHFSTPDEGKQLAKIRAEEFLCRKSVYYGSSSIPFLLPGFTFDLDGHYQKSSNQKYLLTEVNHEGHQTGYLVSGISSALESRSEQMFYANSFAAIPAETQFRPERTAVRPKISGTFNAKVDAASSGQYAEIDDQGRYKVILPLDRSGRGSGKASAWCRMMQPYAGADYGMHFPLHKGTEVLLTFIDGDPDRPIIAGSVPNPETGSPVKGPNQTQSMIRSGGKNQLHFEDQQGSEQIYLFGTKDWEIKITNDKNQTVGNNETLSVSTNRDKTVGSNQSEKIGSNKTIAVGSNHTETIGSNMSLTVGGNQTEMTTINSAETVGVAKELSIGGAYQVSVGAAMNETVAGAKAEEIGAVRSINVGGGSSENIGGDKSIDAGKDISASSGKKMTLTAGDDFTISGGKKGVIDIKDQLTIKCGKATITLKKNGDIAINGKKINVKGSGNIVMKGSKIIEN